MYIFLLSTEQTDTTTHSTDVGRVLHLFILVGTMYKKKPRQIVKMCLLSEGIGSNKQQI